MRAGQRTEAGGAAERRPRGGDGSEIEQFPVALGQFTRREFPDDDLLARQPITAAREFARQHLTCRVSAGVVAPERVHRPVQRQGQMFGEASRRAPAHRLERIDVREAVAEQQHVGGRIGHPRRAAGRRSHGMDLHRLRRGPTGVVRQFEHLAEVTQVRDRGRFAAECSSGGRGRQERTEFLGEGDGNALHRRGCPVGVGREVGRRTVRAREGGKPVSGIEDPDTLRLQCAQEVPVGTVVQYRRVLREGAGKVLGMHRCLAGHRQED